MTIPGQFFHDAWLAARHHETAIMDKHPTQAPRGAWRSQNPAPPTTWRLIKGDVSFSASMEPTIPVLKIATMAARPKLVAQIDLREPGADEALIGYGWPAPGDMKNHELRAARERLKLTQAQLAALLDLGAAMRVSEYERETNPRTIPMHIARLVRAYADGWRPSDWPP